MIDRPSLDHPRAGRHPVFVILGLILRLRGLSIDGTQPALLLSAAVIVGGGGPALWFVLI